MPGVWIKEGCAFERARRDNHGQNLEACFLCSVEDCQEFAVTDVGRGEKLVAEKEHYRYSVI